MNNLQGLWLSVPPLLFALTFHEFAHAWTAYRLGDPTAKQLGRLTLNPLVHLDPIGTFLLLFAHFGWAKPVPYNPLYLKGNRRRGVLLIALSGPLSNFILAYLSALVVSFMLRGWLPSAAWAYIMFSYSMQVNLILAAFNLIPVPPLDGSKILGNLLPVDLSQKYFALERYGTLILVFLIVSGVSSLIFNPIVDFLYRLVSLGTGLM